MIMKTLVVLIAVLFGHFQQAATTISKIFETTSHILKVDCDDVDPNDGTPSFE